MASDGGKHFATLKALNTRLILHEAMMTAKLYISQPSSTVSVSTFLAFDQAGYNVKRIELSYHLRQ